MSFMQYDYQPRLIWANIRNVPIFTDNFFTLVWQFTSLHVHKILLRLVGIWRCYDKKHQLVFWNLVNFVDFSVIRVSQGSVATYVRCGEMTTQRCIANFQMSLLVKEFLKFDKVTAQSLVASFFGTQCRLFGSQLSVWFFLAYHCVHAWSNISFVVLLLCVLSPASWNSGFDKISTLNLPIHRTAFMELQLQFSGDYP